MTPVPAWIGEQMVRLRIADGWVDDPLTVLTEYARDLQKTLRVYDYAGSGDPAVLTMEEIARTRVIASRISHAEARWLLRRSEGAPWSAVAADADLRDADPDDDGSAYRPALDLWKHLYSDRPSGFSTAKLHKVLHLKRPALYPILDSRLVRRYRRLARRQGQARPDLGRYQYWPAIREDLLVNTESGALGELREQLTAAGDERMQAMSQLTDLRLLDICTWR
jgi:hypothetical protein